MRPVIALLILGSGLVFTGLDAILAFRGVLPLGRPESAYDVYQWHAVLGPIAVVVAIRAWTFLSRVNQRTCASFWMHVSRIVAGLGTGLYFGAFPRWLSPPHLHQPVSFLLGAFILPLIGQALVARFARSPLDRSLGLLVHLVTVVLGSYVGVFAFRLLTHSDVEWTPTWSSYTVLCASGIGFSWTMRPRTSRNVSAP
jgi:hypothetical protein